VTTAVVADDTWPDDDPRWDDDAATVTFGPPPARDLPRPDARAGWRRRLARHRRSLGVGAALVLLTGTTVVVAWRPAGGETTISSPPCRSGLAVTPDPHIQVVVVDGRCAVARYDRATAVLERADRQYLLGQPGDQLLIGDWDCNGTVTPALYRPDDGTLHLFTAWADRVPLASGPPRATGVTQGVALVHHHGRCDRVDVERPVDTSGHGRTTGTP
jgi:hypothetical protein